MSKQDVLDKALLEIEKKFGKGSIMKMTDGPVEKVPVISSGSIKLDKALGVFGYPRGRIIEIYGPESSGKTTLTLQAIAEAQKKGGTCAFVDAEHAFDPEYATKLGIDIEALIVSQPDNGEQALGIVEVLVSSGAVDLVVVDSVSALVPKAEIDGDMGDSHMGLQARMMSQGLRKLTAITNKSKTTIIFINQLRMKIGVMFGNPETTTGGNALKFYASIRLDIRKYDTVKTDSDIVGNKVRIKVVKNKVAPPFKMVETVIIFGQGLDILGEVVDLASEAGIVKKSGSWYSYNDIKIGQGTENTKTYLKEHPELYDEIYKRLMNPEIQVALASTGTE